MILRVITPPSGEPVALDDMKNYLRIDFSDDDTLIGAYISAAREHCEAYQNRAYLTQTLELTHDHFPHHHFREAEVMLFYPFFNPGYSQEHHHRHRNAIVVPRPPIQSIESVTYTDSTGVTTTIDPSVYIADTDSEPGRIVPASGQKWPEVPLQPINGVKVRYTAGYGTADKVPARVKQAIMLLVSHWYQNREAVSVLVTRSAGAELPFGVQALLSSERVVPT